jgi:biotin-(acetyl-CoA carboxylase) ligase
VCRQAERDKLSEARFEQARQHAEEMASEQVASIKAETHKLVELLNSNTELTRQDKELTERVEALTREIHTRVTKG